MVPERIATRTLIVYVGGRQSGGTLTAHLSDGSAPDYVNTAYSGGGQYNAVYTLTITLPWLSRGSACGGPSRLASTGNVTLQAAALK